MCSFCMHLLYIIIYMIWGTSVTGPKGCSLYIYILLKKFRLFPKESQWHHVHCSRGILDFAQHLLLSFTLSPYNVRRLIFFRLCHLCNYEVSKGPEVFPQTYIKCYVTYICVYIYLLHHEPVKPIVKVLSVCISDF